MPIIHVDLSAESVARALEEIKSYRDKVESLGERVVERLTTEGEQMAQMLAPMDTGELMSSIEGEANGEKGYIRATAGHAAYVEFGTGVVGEGTHPNPVGWAYDVNGHGTSGWVYKDDFGQFTWTMGQPANPFMYNTAQLLADVTPEVVAEELNT